MKKVIALLSAGLVGLGTVTPAFAQEFGQFGAFESRRAAEATFNFRVPLGGGQRAEKPTYGLTFGVNAGGQTFGSAADRAVDIADFRLAGKKLDEARIGGLDFATRTTTVDGERVGLNVGEWTATQWIIAAVVIGGIIWLVEEEDDDD